MSVITQPKDLADLLRFEAESRYSRERVTLASGHNLTLGTVIATDTATGKIAPLDLADTGSLNQASGVLLSRDGFWPDQGIAQDDGVTDHHQGIQVVGTGGITVVDQHAAGLAE